MFAFMSLSQCIVRSTPVPTPATTPVGPYRLSIQPITGSLADDVTVLEEKKKFQRIFLIEKLQF
jgi:hypothetical protein